MRSFALLQLRLRMLFLISYLDVSVFSILVLSINDLYVDVLFE